MTESDVKKGYELAEKELKDKQVQEVKQIVLKTLEKIKGQEKIRDEASKKIKILKMDIDDLKDGKLDRIVERQEKDVEAKDISVVIIIREEHNHYNNPWYVPYRIVWNQPYWAYALGSTTSGNALSLAYTSSGTSMTNAYSGNINCSVAKDATIGTYDLADGRVTYIR